MTRTSSAREDKRMIQLIEMFKRLFGNRSQSQSTEMRSIVMMQRKAHRFTEEELEAAGEGGWRKKFDGKEDPMYFVSVNDPLTVVKAGPHIIQVTSVSNRYADDDAYALSQLPQPEQKKAWAEHHACVFLEFFNDLSSKSSKVPDKWAYASLANLALQLGDSNCAAIFVLIKKWMMPNDGTAEQVLRLLIDKGYRRDADSSARLVR